VQGYWQLVGNFLQEGWPPRWGPRAKAGGELPPKKKYSGRQSIGPVCARLQFLPGGKTRKNKTLGNLKTAPRGSSGKHTPCPLGRNSVRAGPFPATGNRLAAKIGPPISIPIRIGTALKPVHPPTRPKGKADNGGEKADKQTHSRQPTFPGKRLLFLGGRFPSGMVFLRTKKKTQGGGGRRGEQKGGPPLRSLEHKTAVLGSNTSAANRTGLREPAQKTTDCWPSLLKTGGAGGPWPSERASITGFANYWPPRRILYPNGAFPR